MSVNAQLSQKPNASKHDWSHFGLRLVAALIAAHIILIYGEPYSTFELLVDPAYYRAFPGSFIIALILIELVYRTSSLLEKHLPAESSIFRYAFLQLMIGVVSLSILAFVLAAIYFRFYNVNILETKYLDYDFPFIIAKITILNLLYFIAYLYRRYQRAQHAAPLLAVNHELNEGIEEARPTAIRVSRSITVDHCDIRYIYFKDGVTSIYTDGEVYVINSNLNALEQELAGDGFMRINRQMIVSLLAVVKVNKDGARLSLKLMPELEDEVLVSKLHTPEFRRWVADHFDF